jgi:hypothetical protein
MQRVGRAGIRAQLPVASPGHHLHEAGLSDELAEVLASPEYVVKKAAHVGNESLALDRDGIDRTARPATTTWRTSQVPTGAGYLLHGLTSRGDIAGTLLAALSRTRVDSGAAGRLRGIAGIHGFDILWTTTEPAGAVAHSGIESTRDSAWSTRRQGQWDPDCRLRTRHNDAQIVCKKRWQTRHIRQGGAI